MKKPNKNPESPSIPDLVCACATVRRTARLITQLYSHEMGGRIEPPQYALLEAINGWPGANQTALGHALGFDKATLSRNLAVLKRNGWIAPAKAEDQREKGYKLTSSGEKLYHAAQPDWKRAQEKLQSAMTGREWKKMMKAFGLASRAAQTAILQ